MTAWFLPGFCSFCQDSGKLQMGVRQEVFCRRRAAESFCSFCQDSGTREGVFCRRRAANCVQHAAGSRLEVCEAADSRQQSAKTHSNVPSCVWSRENQAKCAPQRAKVEAKSFKSEPKISQVQPETQPKVFFCVFLTNSADFSDFFAKFLAQEGPQSVPRATRRAPERAQEPSQTALGRSSGDIFEALGRLSKAML